MNINLSIKNRDKKTFKRSKLLNILKVQEKVEKVMSEQGEVL